MSLASLSFEDREVYLHIGPSSWCHLPHPECWDPCDLSDMNDIEEAIDNEFLSLLNPQSGEGDGN